MRSVRLRHKKEIGFYERSILCATIEVTYEMATPTNELVREDRIFIIFTGFLTLITILGNELIRPIPGSIPDTAGLVFLTIALPAAVNMFLC